MVNLSYHIFGLLLFYSIKRCKDSGFYLIQLPNRLLFL
nr:MAG TPA: hypothetical protein [Caudoviricetes sp.]